MVTQRSILLGFVGGCFYLITLVNTLPPYYYALTWLSVGLLASALGLALLSLVGLDCQCSVENQAVGECVPGEAGSPAVMQAVLANRGSFNKTGVVLEVLLVPDQNAADANEERAGRRGRSHPLVAQRFVIEALPSGTHLTTQLPLTQLPRGKWKVQAVRLVGTDVLGLFRTARRVPCNMEPGVSVRVSPAVLEAGSGFIWQNRAAGRLQGSMDSRYRVGQGDDLRGTRPYVPGDDLRRVHWKSTARAGQLVVKEYHQRGRTASVVVWDGAAGTHWAGGLATEWSLRLVNSLHHGLVAQGSPCDLLLCSAQTQSTPYAQLARTGFDTSHEALALAFPDRQSPLTTAAGALSQDYREIYLVTASVGHDVVDCVRAWTSHRARVTLLLVNGAALHDAAAPPRLVRRGRESDHLQQPVWSDSRSELPAEKSSQGSMQPAGSMPFAEQREALARAGAHVVQVMPLEQFELGDYGAPLREALQMALSPARRQGKSGREAPSVPGSASPGEFGTDLAVGTAASAARPARAAKARSA